MHNDVFFTSLLQHLIRLIRLSNLLAGGAVRSRGRALPVPWGHTATSAFCSHFWLGERAVVWKGGKTVLKLFCHVPLLAYPDSRCLQSSEGAPGEFYAPHYEQQ